MVVRAVPRRNARCDLPEACIPREAQALSRTANGRRSLACEAMRQVAVRTGALDPLSNSERRRHLGAISRAGARLLYTDSEHHTSRPGWLSAYCELNLDPDNEQVAHFHPKSDTTT